MFVVLINPHATSKIGVSFRFTHGNHTKYSMHPTYRVYLIRYYSNIEFS